MEATTKNGLSELRHSFWEQSQKLPESVTLGRTIYRKDCNYCFSDRRFVVSYTRWDTDRNFFDLHNVLFEKTFEVCDKLPDTVRPERGQPVDSTIYVYSVEAIFHICRSLLEEHNCKEINEVPKSDTSANYTHLVPDSQYFDALEQILSYVSSKGDDEYLKASLENTIKNGYELSLKKP